MKLKIKKSKLYKIIIIILIFISIITVMYFLLNKILWISRDRNIDSPAKTVVLNSDLDIKMNFNNIVGDKGSIEKFKNIINKAQRSIEIAVFSIKSDTLKKALYEANARGVKVTMILDISNKLQHDRFLNDLPSSIRRLDAGIYDKVNTLNSIYMHHKFMIIDRGFPTQELVAGSLNFTDVGEKYNQSFFFVTGDTELVRVYGNEFDIINAGDTGISKLSKKAYDPYTEKINYTNGFIEVWMSPGFSTRSAKHRILNLIDNATTSIELMMWDFSDRNIADALLKRAIGGIHVSILTEDTRVANPDSVISYLISQKIRQKINNLEIILDTKSTKLVTEKMPYFFSPYLHEHTMIVDDKIVVFGTNNWSNWGFYHNDEDILISDNKYLVDQFIETFDFFYKNLK